MQVFRGGIGRLTCIGSYVNKQVTTFTFRAQATTCSKHHTRTAMDAGCECAPWVRSANPSNSWALVIILSLAHSAKICGKLPLKIPQHLKCVATLPCKTRMLQTSVLCGPSHTLLRYEPPETLRVTGSNCGKRIKLSFVDLNSRISINFNALSVTISDWLLNDILTQKSVFAPTFYSLLHQMPFSIFFSVVSVNSILSLNQTVITSISNSFKQLYLE